MRVAVVGGGISGLTTAYQLKDRGVDVTLYEASESLGGNIVTEARDGFLLEHGPNSLLASRPLLDLITKLGLSDRLLIPKADGKRRYIVRDGKLTELPSSLTALVNSKAFSSSAKLRLLKEPFINSRAGADETVMSFFERRFGKEIADFAVDPFVSGIYAGDGNRLSIKYAFPRLFEYEARYGSVIRGAMFSRKPRSERLPKGFPRSFSFRGGMITLIDAFARALGDVVRTGVNVRRVVRDPSGYAVHTADEIERFDTVVASVPATSAAELLNELDRELPSIVEGIYYPPIAVVYTGFRSEQISNARGGFGFLVPAVERRRILGTIFTSSVFDGRAPAGVQLFTTFIGGSRDAHLCDKTNEDLIGIAADEIRELIGIAGEPVFSAVKKWPRSIPQYNVGYEAVLESVNALQRKQPGIFVCSNFYQGIAVSDCVRNANETADAVSAFLADKRN